MSCVSKSLAPAALLTASAQAFVAPTGLRQEAALRGAAAAEVPPAGLLQEAALRGAAVEAAKPSSFSAASVAATGAVGALAVAVCRIGKRRRAARAQRRAQEAPRSVSPSALYTSLLERSGKAGKSLAGLPPSLPMPLLSTWTAVPVFSSLAAVFTPSRVQLARVLAGALGVLFGTVAGAFLERSKKEAARCAIVKLLAEKLQTGTSAEQLRTLVEAERRRFGVPVNSQASESWEDSQLGGVYEALLNALLEGPEHDPQDLPLLKKLKAALDLDGTVIGNAHRHAAQLLVSKGYSGMEEGSLRHATDKLLFLSQCAFADEDTEEASAYEMGRVRQVLRISDKDARQRINAVSTALYRQNLSAVVDKVDSQTGEALQRASAAFGLDEDETAGMNAETYRQIAARVLASGRLAPEGRSTLQSAQGVLQLGDRAATASFVAVASPILLKDVEAVANTLIEKGASTPSSELEEKTKHLTQRGEELGLRLSDSNEVIFEGLLTELRNLYNSACKDARINGPTKALATLDKILAFAAVGDQLLASLKAPPKEEGSEEIQVKSLTMPAETAPAKRLYSIFLERSLDKEASVDPKSCDELARILEIPEAEQEQTRVEVCQPRLRELFEKSIEASQAAGAEPLSRRKVEVNALIDQYRLPPDAVEETAIEVYKGCLMKVAGKVLKAAEKDALDEARGFLGLDEAGVRLLHLRAFAKTYEDSVDEAMGRSGIMAPEAKEALAQLQKRLGLADEDALKIFHATVEVRLRDMMSAVREAWEEATYTKEALVQINKERGKDIGDDPFSDGTGAELGIKDTPALEGVRGFKLMQELTKMANFYTSNGVKKEGDTLTPEEMYPVTIGKYVEDKTKEEMYGIYTWNAITCQDATSRESWDRAKPIVGGVLGLSPDNQTKVLVRMVSRWANGFIKMKIQDQGELSEDDISTLQNWVPTFFGIDKDITKTMVQAANKSMLQSKVLKLLNKPTVTPEDLQKLRDEVQTWELTLKKDLELTKPQLRSLFRIEVAAALEDPDLSDDQKQEALSESQEAFGLGDTEVVDELKDLMQSRCRGCLVNAVGDLLQGNEPQAIKEMQRLELLATFCENTGIKLRQEWDVAPAMRQQVLKVYSASPEKSQSGKAPNIRLLERTLGLVTA